AEHHLLDHPRDTPVRTGIGAAGLMVFFIMFLEGGNDIFGVLLNVTVETVTRILQWSLVIAPILTFLVTYWICKGLSRTRLRPAQIHAGVRLSRPPARSRGGAGTPRARSGGSEPEPLEPTSVDGDRTPAATGPHTAE